MHFYRNPINKLDVTMVKNIWDSWRHIDIVTSFTHGTTSYFGCDAIHIFDVIVMWDEVISASMTSLFWYHDVIGCDSIWHHVTSSQFSDDFTPLPPRNKVLTADRHFFWDARRPSIIDWTMKPYNSAQASTTSVVHAAPSMSWKVHSRHSPTT